MPLQEPLRAKLGFFDTDLLRLWNVQMRFMQAIIAQLWPGAPVAEDGLGACALVLAIRGWLRQVHTHSPYYKYMARRVAQCVSIRGGGDRELAGAMASVPVRARGEQLEGMDRLLHHVVRKCKGAKFSSE